ncbi:MAG: carboxypeptidase regulatory-like domain-containing protein, partial [Deltaproteobacteria bacterium]|nr:carboxypeptidase regulatory-like domain-containing protein [Deltaproteobacteria bacterium]
MRTHSMKTLSLPLCALALLAAACTQTAVTSSHGAIAGKATYAGETDSSGIAVLIAGPMSAATKTAADGSYSFSQLLAGSYAVVITGTSVLEPATVLTLAVDDSHSANAPDVTFTGVGSIAGRLLVPGGSAEGAIVVVPGTSALAIADANGAYQLDGVASGDQQLIASSPLYGGAVAGGLVVKRGQTTQAADLTLTSNGNSGAGAVSGRLVFSGANAPAGLPVALQGPVSQATLTDATGHFSFSGLADGQYALTAFVRSTLTTTQGRTVEVTQGHGPSDVELGFTPVGTVTGKFLLPGSPASHAGITVTSLGVLSVALTDASGNFTLSGVPAGAHDLVASYPGDLAGTVTNAQVPWDDSLDVGSTTLAVQPALPGALYGTISVLGGSAQSAFVTIAGPTQAITQADASGAWHAGNLAPGAYTISAWVPDSVERIATRTATVGSAQPITAGQNFSFTAAGTLRGQITVAGSPKSGVQVIAIGSGLSTLTGSDGKYTFAQAPAGRAYTVSAFTAGFAGAPQNTTTLAQGQSLTAPTIDLAAVPTKLLTIASSVSRVDGGALGGIHVQLSGPTSTLVDTASDGTWSASVLPGVYQVTIGGGAYAFTVTLKDVLALPGTQGQLWQDGTPYALSKLELQNAQQLVSQRLIPTDAM